MVIREKVKEEIDRMPENVVFSASDIDVPRQYRSALVKALNQFEYAGIIKRVSKGRYYKPRTSRFGVLPPSEKEIVKDFLEKDGETIGYITGTRAFAAMALTTQVSSVIMIGTNISRRPLARGQYKIIFLLQPNRIAKKDIPLLVILDALRLIKEIPGSTPQEAITQISIWIKELSDKDCKRLLKLCMAYKPYVRAQLGAIFEYLNIPHKELLESLNPISHYKLGISETILPTIKNWNIL